MINGTPKNPLQALKEARARVATAAERTRENISQAEAELADLRTELRECEQQLCEFDQDIALRDNVLKVA